ncbi:branched-chain amino acid ABC transporter permease [Zoogloea sp.]|uniref:branched-chain amino acid ABC transporter permease n=1 Tax=Zoogloea sp. TaxID=49181 RepID=UPI001AC4E9C0|nr:branched-chain amino acid ABC transporter permease [Zoogloea sp.]MBN8281974.1 branched-chain amino acid ABC transporter permease [Zoogloea sp.]
MTEFLQQLLNGLSLGAIYALIALGYTMVYGVLRFINFAHGDVFMLGAFAGYFLAPRVAQVLPAGSLAGALVVLVLSMALCAAIGVAIEILAYRPLRRRPRLTVLITAIGVSLLIEFTCQHRLVFGASPRTFPDLVEARNLDLGGVTLGTTQLLVFVLTALLLAALTFVVQSTKVGMAMRAVAFNEQAAALMGVNINRIISFTFGLGSALAAAGGILFAMSYTKIEPLMGVQTGLKAFVAAVLGGIGNLPGAALGGIVLGIVETYAGGVQGLSNYRDGIAFAVLILILLFRPAGLLGRAQIEKV